MTELRQGTRVQTPLGPGTVAYTRGYVLNGEHTINAVSVVLDARRNDPKYTGTIWPIAKITIEK